MHVKDEWSEEAKVWAYGSELLVDGSNVLVYYSFLSGSIFAGAAGKSCARNGIVLSLKVVCYRLNFSESKPCIKIG